MVLMSAYSGNPRRPCEIDGGNLLVSALKSEHRMAAANPKVSTLKWQRHRGNNGIKAAVLATHECCNTQKMKKYMKNS